MLKVFRSSNLVNQRVIEIKINYIYISMSSWITYPAMIIIFIRLSMKILRSLHARLIPSKERSFSPDKYFSGPR